MMEILKSHFKDGEQDKIQKKIEGDEVLKDAYEKIKDNPEYRLTQLEEKIERTDETFEKRFDAWKKAVLEAEKSEGIVDELGKKAKEAIGDIKEKAGEATDELVSDAQEAGKSWVEKKIPGIGKLLAIGDRWSKAMEAFKGKGFIQGIMAFFGVLLGKKNLDSFKEKKEDKSDIEKKEEGKENKIKGEDVTENEVEGKSGRKVNGGVEKKIDVVGNKIEAPIFKAGMGILFKLSGGKRLPNSSVQPVYDDIKLYSFSELMLLTKQYQNNPHQLIDEKIFSDKTKKFFKDKPEEIYSILDKITSENSNIILNDRLSSGNLQVIIDKYDFQKKGLLGDETISQIENGVDYKTLKTKEIAILLVYSIPALSILAVTNISTSLLSDIKDIVGISGEDNELMQELKQVQEGLISTKTISFLSQLGLPNFGGNGRIKANLSDFQSDKEFKRLSLEDQKIVFNDLSKLIDFKNTTLITVVNDIINTEGLNLTKEQKLNIDKAIAKNLNYEKIVELYFLLGGGNGINIDNIKDGTFDKGLVFIWIKSVLDKPETSAVYGMLGGAIVRKYIDKVSGTEKSTMTIILEKIFKDSIREFLADMTAGLNAGKEAIKGHEIEVASGFGLISLFFFKRAKIIGAGALLTAIYLFTSGAGEKFKESYPQEYSEIEEFITNNGKHTIDEVKIDLKNSIKM